VKIPFHGLRVLIVKFKVATDFHLKGRNGIKIATPCVLSSPKHFRVVMDFTPKDFTIAALIYKIPYSSPNCTTNMRPYSLIFRSNCLIQIYYLKNKGIRARLGGLCWLLRKT
jgi:hypothetical protein